MADHSQPAVDDDAAAGAGTERAGEKNAGNATLAPAYRMRSVFERKVVAPYRDTYRGELGQAQVELLELLYQHGPLHQREAVEELRTSKQHVSKMVARLEQMGYVCQGADDADARSHVVALSNTGRAYVDRHIAEGSKRARELFLHLSAEERTELDQAMLTVARLLEKA
ncbi:MAG: MarR family winged helix-turn-helix transcriptional regulator [Parafannyhessea sp.]|uniref:MarR family winged helix-turn-helix transcriptional regulator n=1 Tax=Parafannyhessea sp. TaxID=2847324 RepID=UPI003F119B01